MSDYKIHAFHHVLLPFKLYIYHSCLIYKLCLVSQLIDHDYLSLSFNNQELLPPHRTFKGLAYWMEDLLLPKIMGKFITHLAEGFCDGWPIVLTWVSEVQLNLPTLGQLVTWMVWRRNKEGWICFCSSHLYLDCHLLDSSAVFSFWHILSLSAFPHRSTALLMWTCMEHCSEL